MPDANVSSPAGRRRLPMGFQVHLGVGGLLALVAVSFTVAVVLLMRLEHDQANLDDHNVPYASEVAAAALNAKGAANDQRGFLMTGDRQFLNESGRRISAARAAFVAAAAAAGNGQQQAIAQAQAGFERWVRATRGETATYQAGDHQGAIMASLGVDRILRKDYEQALTTAQTLGADSIRSAQNSFSIALSRSVKILLACLLGALAIGGGVGVWLVRSIALPVYRLVSILAADQPQ
jgi:methyl-accepting chemotaxis protein